jgi:hypothetical protein
MPSKLTVIQDPLPSDQYQHGGESLNQLVLLFTGSNLDSDEDIRLNTTFTFFSGKLALYEDDPFRVYKVFLKAENITTNRNNTVSVRDSTIQNDFMVTESQNQEMNNKTLKDNILFGADIDANSKGLKKLNNTTWGNNTGTEPTATTTELPMYRKDIDANNQAVYFSKIENGQVVKVRVL